MDEIILPVEIILLIATQDFDVYRIFINVNHLFRDLLARENLMKYTEYNICKDGSFIIQRWFLSNIIYREIQDSWFIGLIKIHKLGNYRKDIIYELVRGEMRGDVYMKFKSISRLFKKDNMLYTEKIEIENKTLIRKKEHNDNWIECETLNITTGELTRYNCFVYDDGDMITNDHHIPHWTITLGEFFIYGEA